MKSYFSSGIIFFILEAILFSNSGFNTWKSTLFFQAYCLPKLNLSFKKFDFSHELCAGLSRLNQHCHFCFSFTDFLKLASSLKASPIHSNLATSSLALS